MELKSWIHAMSLERDLYCQTPPLKKPGFSLTLIRTSLEWGGSWDIYVSLPMCCYPSQEPSRWCSWPVAQTQFQLSPNGWTTSDISDVSSIATVSQQVQIPTGKWQSSDFTDTERFSMKLSEVNELVSSSLLLWKFLVNWCILTLKRPESFLKGVH